MGAEADKILKVLLQVKSDVADLQNVVNGLGGVKKKLSETKNEAFGLKQALEFSGVNAVVERMVGWLEQIPERLFEGIKRGIEFNAELQRMELTIAGIIRQNAGANLIDFAGARREANTTIELLKEKANELGISYESIFESFTTSANAMFNAGITDTQKQIDLTVKLNQAMKALGVTGFQASRDIQDILIGRAEMTKAGRELGFKNDALKAAEDEGKLYEFITEKVRGLAEAGHEASNGFNGDVERMKNALLDLESEAAKPLMQPLIEQINKLNEGMRTGEAQAFARTIGDISAAVVRAAGDMVKMFNAFAHFEQDHPWVVKGAAAATGLTGIGAIALAGNSLGRKVNENVAESRETVKMEDALRRVKLIEQEARSAQTLEEKERAIADVSKLIADIEAHIAEKTTLHKEEWAESLTHVRQFAEELPGVLGTSQNIAAVHHDDAKALEAIKKIQDDIALKKAVASGDNEAVVQARAQSASDATLKTLLAAKVERQEALKLAKQEYDATLAEGTAKAGLKDLQKDITQYTREQETVLQNIRQQEQLINASPFLSQADKDRETLQLIVREMAELNLEILKGRALLDGGTLDPEKYEQVKQKIQQARFELDLLGQKTQALTFGGGLQSDLANWVNSFGTAAHQIAQTIEGTINAALQGTNQLLLDSVFRTGDWRQTLVGVERQILNLFLTWIEQMALQKGAQLLGITTTTTAQVASGAAIAAAHAPAAAATSVSSYGTAAIVGEVLAVAAIAAIIAALTGGFKKGGFTGEGDPNDPAGVVHKREYVHDAQTTERLGVHNLEALKRGDAHIAHYAQGGRSQGHAVGSDFRIMAYGPGVDAPGHYGGNIGASGRTLIPGYSVAVSPGANGGFPAAFPSGSFVQINGRTYRVDDTSWIRPGVPTPSDTFEIFGGRDQGRTTVTRIGGGSTSTSTAAPVPITPGPTRAPSEPEFNPTFIDAEPAPFTGYRDASTREIPAGGFRGPTGYDTSGHLILPPGGRYVPDNSLGSFLPTTNYNVPLAPSPQIAATGTVGLGSTFTTTGGEGLLLGGNLPTAQNPAWNSSSQRWEYFDGAGVKQVIAGPVPGSIQTTQWGSSSPLNVSLGAAIPTSGQDWSYGGNDAPIGSIVGSINGQPVVQTANGRQVVPGARASGGSAAAPVGVSAYQLASDARTKFETGFADTQSMAWERFARPDEIGYLGESENARGPLGRTPTLTRAQIAANSAAQLAYARTVGHNTGDQLAWARWPGHANGVRIPGGPSMVDTELAMLAKGEVVISAPKVAAIDKRIGKGWETMLDQMEFQMPGLHLAEGGRFLGGGMASRAGGGSGGSDLSKQQQWIIVADIEAAIDRRLKTPQYESHIVRAQTKWSR